MSKKEVLIVGPNFYGYNESVAKALQGINLQINFYLKLKENIM